MINRNSSGSSYGAICDGAGVGSFYQSPGNPCDGQGEPWLLAFGFRLQAGGAHRDNHQAPQAAPGLGWV